MLSKVHFDVISIFSSGDPAPFDSAFCTLFFAACDSASEGEGNATTGGGNAPGQGGGGGGPSGGGAL